MKCFYHNADLDGKCSAAIVRYAYPKVELIGIDYGDPFPWDSLLEGEEVYMVDFSLQPFEEMCRLANLTQLIWIDHHKTAIEAAQESGRYFRGIQRVGSGACALVWEWFVECEKHKRFECSPLPTPVRLLAEYDVWDHDDSACLPFQYGMRERDANPAGELWDVLLACMSYNTRIYEDIIHAGTTILNYTKRQDEIRAKTLSFEMEFEGLRIIAMNHSISNSKVFDAVWDSTKYDAMMLFAWHGDQWKISLYTNKENIDVSVIAKAYGGGGHRGAAGFKCDKLPFSIQNKEESVVLDADANGRTAVKDEEDTFFADFDCSMCIHFVRDVRWESDECIHHTCPKNALLLEGYTRPTWCPLSGRAIATMESAKALVRNAEGAISTLKNVIKEIQSGKRIVSLDTTVASLIYEVI